MIRFLGGDGIVRRSCAIVLLWGLAAMSSAADVSSSADRVAELWREIARHDELYFKKAAPEISDVAYDRLKRELKELERETSVTGVVNERVGDDRSGRFPTWRHGERMMSLEKVYSDVELRAFLRGVNERLEGKPRVEKARWVLEPKYDGLAVSAIYERGQLVRLVTRGDGSEGDDVTVNADAIRGLARRLEGDDWPERIEMRGEVYVSFAEFERVNAQRSAAGEAVFANPRALAAGSLKLGNAAVVTERGLGVVFYGWGEVIPESAKPRTQLGFHEQLEAWGAPGVAWRESAETAERVVEGVAKFPRWRNAAGFPTDGMVIKLDDVASREEVGATEHAPRWAVAYKFTTVQATTRLKAITVQVGRSGVLTPVAELEPVRLDGAVVTRATLHNADEIARLDIRVGDDVLVEKAGEVIPSVVGVDRAGDAARGRAWVFPEDCPTCGAAVMTREEGAAMRYCSNRDCSGQVQARLRHFAGPNGVAIRGLGEGTIAALVEKGGVRTVADIYRMRAEDWREVAGVGAKTAQKISAAVEVSKRAELWRFIHGLSVPGVGVATSRILAQEYGSLERLAAASEADFSRVDGVGAMQARALVQFFLAAENRQLIAELAASGVAPSSGEDRAKLATLSGKVFVFTGTLPTLTRAEAERRVVAAGGVVATSVTAKSDFLVAGAETGERRRRAEELSVAIIDESEFLRLLAEGVTDQ